MVDNLTQHANQRMAQRGIRQAELEFALRYGRWINYPGTVAVFLGVRDIPLELRDDPRFEKLQGTTIILSPFDYQVITVFKERDAIRKIRRHKARAFAPISVPTRDWWRSKSYRKCA